MNIAKLIVASLCVSSTLGAYQRMCDDKLKLQAKNLQYNFTYTFDLKPKPGMIHAGLPRACGVILTKDDLDTIIKVLSPFSQRTIDPNLLSMMIVPMVKEVLQDFKEHKKTNSVNEVLQLMQQKRNLIK